MVLSRHLLEGSFPSTFPAPPSPEKSTLMQQVVTNIYCVSLSGEAVLCTENSGNPSGGLRSAPNPAASLHHSSNSLTGREVFAAVLKTPPPRS